MKVKELIEKLQQFDPEMEVMCDEALWPYSIYNVEVKEGYHSTDENGMTKDPFEPSKEVVLLS